jgi:hypothetical protein
MLPGQHCLAPGLPGRLEPLLAGVRAKGLDGGGQAFDRRRVILISRPTTASTRVLLSVS